MGTEDREIEQSEMDLDASGTVLDNSLWVRLTHFQAILAHIVTGEDMDLGTGAITSCPP